MRFLRPWLAVIPLIAVTVSIYAEDGLAWEVQGNWRVNQIQTFLHRGDSVAPGALLTAASLTNASVVVLLPDGQRLFFDCHNAHTCNQGFRVPPLMAKPDDEAVQLFETVRRAMRQPETAAATSIPVTATRTESVVLLQTDGTISLKEPLAHLPPGQYRMTVLGEGGAQLSERSLAWPATGDATRLSLPHAGIYHLRLFGSLGVERMRVVLLAATPEFFPARQKAFAEARKDLQEWNENFPGWPTHEWLQLFLDGLAQEPGKH